MSELDSFILVLLKICALPANAQLDANDFRLLTLAKDDLAKWNEALEILKINEVESLLYYSLKYNQLLSQAPTTIINEIFDSYADRCIRNRTLINTLERILSALNARGIVPALWKGIVLAQDFYPDFGTRSMSDLDFFIPLCDRNKALEVFTDLAFKKSEFLDRAEDSFNGIDDNGVFVDVHFRARFFEKFKHEELYFQDSSSQIKNKFLTLEKNAFLALLIEHQRGHIFHDGIKFRFLFDLIFFYRRCGLDFDQLSKYFDSRHWNLLNKSNALIKQIAPDLEFKIIDLKQSFTVSEIRRSSLLSRWGLFVRYKAWLRLVLTWLGLIKSKYKIAPSVSDVICCFFDRIKA